MSLHAAASSAAAATTAWGSLRLTPSSSPFAKGASARSPVKTARQDSAAVGLSLRQVIGTTTASVNGLDGLPSARAFAFTAGGAAVVATVHGEGKDCRISQRFYRARPTAAPLNAGSATYGPSTPNNSHTDGRNRAVASLRDGNVGISPFGSPMADWADSPGNKTWSARERVKAATSVSFSPDGKFVAVGETGYKPRVLVFSTSTDIPSDAPVICLAEHTFGVRCVAFSPDSQFLASLGSLNDGFLYVWQINHRTGTASLHSTNKCTSNIHQMIWLGSNLITVGTRHVKLWRVEEQGYTSPTKPKSSDTSALVMSLSHKALPGRNCLLGPMLDATFTSAVAVSPTKAIICSEKGDVCLLDDGDGGQRLTKISSVPFGVATAALGSNSRVHLAGSDGSFTTMILDDLLSAKSPTPPSPAKHSPVPSTSSGAIHIIAMVSLNDMLVTVDSRRAMRLLDLDPDDDETIPQRVIRQVPGHGDAILGLGTVQLPNIFDASFFTFSAEGRVLFWSLEGVCGGEVDIEVEQPDVDDDRNELKTVKASSGVGFLVSGDKYGVLRIMKSETREEEFCFKAHSGEVTDIAIFEDAQTFVASSGRDRTVQIFQKKVKGWDLAQTLDEHVGAVTGLLFSADGSKLLSSSSDRTVVVREAATIDDEGSTMTAFLIARTITLKATPVSIALGAEHEDTLLLSTMDRHVHKHDLRTGHVISSFKASDSESGDSVVVSSLVPVPSSKGSLIAGVSSTDKSIRLYDESGNLLCRDYGHTEGVTAIALITPSSPADADAEPKRCLVTAALDGTIFMWNLDAKTPQRHDSILSSKALDLVGTTPTRDLLVHRPPLRRVLSHSELARFQRTSPSPSPSLSTTADENTDPKDGTSTPTPTGARSPKLRKRPSKFGLAQTPKLDPSITTAAHRATHNPTTAFQTPPPPTADARRAHPRNRSPSPPSPRTTAIAPPPQGSSSKARRGSVDARAVRTRASASGPSSASNILNGVAGPAAASTDLTAAADALTRQLRAFRKRLASAPPDAAAGGGGMGEAARELERELGTTQRAVGERVVGRRGKRGKAEGGGGGGGEGSVKEEVLVGLLNRYSERLVEMLDGKMRARGEAGARDGSVGSIPEEGEEGVRIRET